MYAFSYLWCNWLWGINIHHSFWPVPRLRILHLYTLTAMSLGVFWSLCVPNILFKYIYSALPGCYGKMDAVPMVDAWYLFKKRGLTGPIWKFQGFCPLCSLHSEFIAVTQWSGLLHILYMCRLQFLESMVGWGQFFWVFQLVHLRII